MINLTSSPEIIHYPVMLNEVTKICSPKNGGTFIDCTFGGGGYSKKILKFNNTKVLAFDRDKFILTISKKLEKQYPKRFSFYQKKFSQINTVIKDDSAEAVIFDLGLSTIQLKNLDRGFSFHSKSSLDMSMGLSKISAEEVVNKFSEQQLKLIIKILGEEKDASIIAKNIVKARSISKIIRVDQLVDIINRSKKKNYNTKINPSTKTFQALRIFVNKEITELINGIIKATKILKPGGKILAVSFHSIEDKVIKYFFRNYSRNKSRPSRYIPDDKSNNPILFEKYINQVITPTKREVKMNNPSRSAKLRFAVRNDNAFVMPDLLFSKFKKYLEIEAFDV